MSKEKEKGIEELYSYLIKNKDEISKEEYEELKKDFKNTLLKAYSEKSISKEFFEEYSQKIKELEEEGGIKKKRTKYCSQCGSENDEDAEFCKMCGYRFSIAHTITKEKTGTKIPISPHKEDYWKNGQVITLISSIVMIFACFLPFGKIGTIPILGIESDGIFIAIIGGIVLFLIIVKKDNWKSITVLGILSLLIWIILFFRIGSLIVEYRQEMESIFDYLFMPSFGEGFYLVLLGNIGILIGAWRIESLYRKQRYL